MLSCIDPSPTVGKNAGAYRPGHKPPPIPINTSISNSFSTSPLSPGNTTSGGLMSPFNSASPRPSLPFMEKYAKKTKTPSPPAPLPLPQSNSDRQDQASASYGAHQHQQQQQQLPRSSIHYQREQNDYFTPKAPADDRFAVAAAFAAAMATSAHQQQNRESQSVLRSYAAPHTKTPTTITSESAASSSSRSSPNPSFTSRTSQYNQPAVPQKSNARTPSMASVHALGGQGNQGYDYNRRSKSSLGNNTGQSPYAPSDVVSRDRERDRIRERANRSAPIPVYGSQYSHPISTPVAPMPVRSGSSMSVASAVRERRANRDRSNTMMSEQSEITLRSEPIRLRTLESNTTVTASDRHGRSERDRARQREKEQPLTPSSSRSEGRSRRLQDAASAYKTPSPPVSLRGDDGDIPAVAVPTKGSAYRPPTPPEIASPIPTRGKLLFFFFFVVIDATKSICTYSCMVS